MIVASFARRTDTQGRGDFVRARRANPTHFQHSVQSDRREPRSPPPHATPPECLRPEAKPPTPTGGEPAATLHRDGRRRAAARMGNKIARTTQASATEYYLHDLPSTYNLVLLDVVSRGRFLKSVLCKHDEGLLLVKVYFKRAGEPLDLKEHERRLERIRRTFQELEGSHVLPFQVWFQTDKAAYLLRQYFYSNLHDRLSTRPFLSQIEKKWLAFQLIHAVEQSHSKGVCHGDIKCENVLVTSWNWLYLTDFASFKPTYIPDDDPSDFSFFFDTGGRRRCYLAPEWEEALAFI